jgi:hypothetical protein
MSLRGRLEAVHQSVQQRGDLLWHVSDVHLGRYVRAFV